MTDNQELIPNPEYSPPVPDEPMQGALSTLAAGNPALYFFMKYWHFIIIAFLVVLLTTLGFGAWKYHEYMNERLTKVNVELSQQKDRADDFENTLGHVREDIATAVENSNKYKEEIESIKRSNDDLRRRIANLGASIPKGATAAEVQVFIDELRNDLNNRWNSVGVDNETTE